MGEIPKGAGQCYQQVWTQDSSSAARQGFTQDCCGQICLTLPDSIQFLRNFFIHYSFKIGAALHKKFRVDRNLYHNIIMHNIIMVIILKYFGHLTVAC